MGFRKARGKVGHSYRYVKEGNIQTLFGRDTRKAHCRKCHTIKAEADFYHAHEKHVWRHCIECDDKRRRLQAKIKVRRDKGLSVDEKLVPTATIEFFLGTSDV